MVRTALHVLLHLLSVALYHIIIVMQLLFFFTGGLCQSFVVLYSCKLPMVLFISFYPLQKHSEERVFFFSYVFVAIFRGLLLFCL